MTRKKMKEETLDPENWEAMRVLGHRILDDTLDSLENVRNSPVWETIAENLFKKISEPIPLEPQGAERAYQDLREILSLEHELDQSPPELARLSLPLRSVPEF